MKPGDQIICIKNHSQGVVKQGQVYTCIDIQQPKCKCTAPVVNVGIQSISLVAIVECLVCKCRYMSEDNIWWLDSRLFATIDSFKKVEFTKITEQMPICSQ